MSEIEETNDNGANVDSINTLDFNVENEYKPDPLIPKSTYHGSVFGVKYDSAGPAIVWDVVLHDNGGLMNDNSTQIDGQHVFFRNWLPKPGDESVPTKSGRSNKRDSKIKMLGDFATAMGIDMNTPTIIAQSLADQIWIGMEVDVDVVIDEYQGSFRNSVNKMKKSSTF